MSRIKNAIKIYGIKGCFIKMMKKISYKLYIKYETYDIRQMRRFKTEYVELETKCKDSKYKTVFVFYPYTEWDIPVFQRPQQIALSLTKNKDVLYLFCTKNCQYDHINGLYKEIKENLLIVTDFDFVDKMNIKNKVVHLYSTDTISDYKFVKKNLKHNKVLYEYIDEIHESISGYIPKSFYYKHEHIMKNEKIFIIATADKLLNDVKKIRDKNFALSTNGVTIEDFELKKSNIPKKIKDIKSKYKKLICYYGSLAVWFDYKLLIKCAKKYPNYAFILIGFEYDDSYKKSKVSEYENIIYLGKIDYKELINYTKHVDLLTIPFVINEVTESTSPVKLFEYMATKKPILTTAMPECRKYKSVVIGENHNDFIKKIDSTIKLIKDKKYYEIEEKEAKENTWDNKANIILKLVNKGEK